MTSTTVYEVYKWLNRGLKIARQVLSVIGYGFYTLACCSIGIQRESWIAQALVSKKTIDTNMFTRTQSIITGTFVDIYVRIKRWVNLEYGVYIDSF